MYEAYWGITELPFLQPGHRPASRMHEEAMCRIIFLLESDYPIVLLTGKKGAGKSSLLHQLKNRWKKSNEFSVLHVDFHKIPIRQVASSLLAQTGHRNISNETLEKSWSIFQQCVRENRQNHSLVIFDHISTESVEASGTVQYLYHLAQQPQFPLNLVVVLDTDSNAESGQVLLDRYLDLSPMQNNLEFLTHFEMRNYIHSALERVGAKRVIFDDNSLNALFNSTNGQLGKINQLCDVCMLAGMLDRREIINEVIVHAAAAELWTDRLPQSRSTSDGHKKMEDIVFPESTSQQLDIPGDGVVTV